MVVGGSRGIGAAIVRRLSAAGATVAFTYHGSAEAADALAASSEGVSAVKCDSADAAALAETVEHVADRFGSIDILVYNAGVGLSGSVDQMNLADFDRTFAINVRGAFVATKAASPRMGEGGRIIFIGSNVTQRAAFSGAAAYVMSKSAIAGLARGLSQDFALRKITVNTVQPGPVDTDLNPADGPKSGPTLSLIPLGRFGETSEIASLVAYLAGPESSFITGAALTINGGYSV
ncbi:SDR family oxidoreductase [Tianweitania aestuarii]|nr:SDR family oxidoreductase [Tianweitania aestuarii]